ncbi:general odorant-binding protein 56d-like [Eupeodes corollae]|uniref:general odorant-binding protein 56d-like n=1 Tax=Eupeodes corollae TaxID=290404 RepID=UPI002492A4C3|nr:general odorant-binding protein 56d-like [Eupeodes corollae]
MPIQLIALVLALILFGPQILLISSSMRTCFENEGITEKDAEMFFNRSTLGKISPKMKCFGACIVESMNLIDGCNLKYEEAKKNYTMEQKFDMVLALDVCKDSAKGSGRCECGYEVFNCIDNYYEKHVRQ